MISRIPALAALCVASAVLLCACATSISGTAAAPAPSTPLTSASAFPSTTQNSTGGGSSTGGGTVSPQPTPTTVTPPTATTVPGTWSVTTARLNYVSYVRVGNVHVAQLKALYARKKVSVATFTNLCATLAVDQTQFAKRLQAGRWPATVQPLIDRFVPAVISLGYSYIRCSDAKTVAKAKAILATSTDTTPLANAVRKALKLPLVK